jgi:heme oxygenase
MSAADYATDDEVIWVWPQNVAAINLFVFLGTQWLVGPSGPYGLNYRTMWEKMDRMNLTPEAHADLEADIRVLEDAALEAMRAD